MPTLLSNQERRILAAARKAGVITTAKGIAFDVKQAAKDAGIAQEEATELLKGLRRFGFVSSVGSKHGQLTESGIRAADGLATPPPPPETGSYSPH